MALIIFDHSREAISIHRRSHEETRVRRARRLAAQLYEGIKFQGRGKIVVHSDGAEDQYVPGGVHPHMIPVLRNQPVAQSIKPWLDGLAAEISSLTGEVQHAKEHSFAQRTVEKV